MVSADLILSLKNHNYYTDEGRLKVAIGYMFWISTDVLTW